MSHKTLSEAGFVGYTLGIAALGIAFGIGIREHAIAPNVRTIPDVVIEREFPRRIDAMALERCSYCNKCWQSCRCQMGASPASFQRRQQASEEELRIELMRYGAE